jgi:signal transduction histidine kinase/pSer/pThr/pTyr-binding forkhead associated (FHA) protein
VPRLMVIKGLDEGRQFELRGPVLGVGRDASNPIRLHDTEVSRRHAEFRLTLDGTAYRVYDRGSANGVYVNGQPVQEALLRSGDQVQIGQTVLVYSLGRGEGPPAGDLADRIRMIAPPDTELSSQIVRSIGEAEGRRILAHPDESASPWLRTRLANLAILYEASQAVSHILDLDQLLDRILELTFRSIDADRGCVMLLHPDTKALEPKAVRWRRPAGAGHEPMAVSRTITDHVLRERQGVLVSDAAQDRRFAAGQSVLRFGIREAICVPMKGRHETLGVVYLDTVTPVRASPEPPAPKFTEDHLALAIALAHQAALAVEETRYYQAMVQAERLAAVGQTIAALSHHIKNILQGLRSGSDILRLGMGEKDEELLQQGWRIVDKNQGKIYDLVLDMLSFSKEREPAVEPTDLNALAGEVVELMKGRAGDLGVTLTTSHDPDLSITPADPEGIHRALLNLVGNALDAVEGRPGAMVLVATEAEPGGEWVRIEVTDNGVGIEPDKLDDIFKPFISSKGSRGTGLGLAISRKTLREHGGDVLVESRPGAGSTFTLRLPLKSPHAPDSTTPPLEPPEPN